MGLPRRQFLGKALAAFFGLHLGTGEQLVWAADLYARKLAQPTKRKLALLIGINQYEAKGDWLPLNGCVTDVDLQRELLIHRFGFNPKDIVTLTDRQATRQAIAQAFTEHLIGQVLPGDVVVVHFSGHGSRLGQYNTFVPVDASSPDLDGTVSDLTDNTLFMWLRSISSDQIACILDTGHNYPGTPVVGNFRIRARPGRREWQLSPQEFALQQQLVAQSAGIGGSNAPSNSKAFPGIVLRAAGNDRLCADALWQGFSSGVFTYALTQQLWQITPAISLHVAIGNVIGTLDQQAFRSQEPALEKQIASHVLGADGKTFAQNSLSAYFNNPEDLRYPNNTRSKFVSQSADGAIETVTVGGKAGEIWLAGLPLCSLGYYSAGSVLSVCDDRQSAPPDRSSSPNPTLVQVRSHNGLTAKVEVIESDRTLQVGQLLQEQIRALPRNLGLTIALDLELSKIERVDATSALSTFPQMTVVNATEQFADCLFGMQSTSYGLFTAGRNPILGSFGAVGESVGAAIKRLWPQLEGLLAAKLIRLTANQGSSCLGLKITMETSTAKSSNPVLLDRKATFRSEFGDKVNVDAIADIQNKSLAIGDRLHCRLENLSDRPLYTHIFSFDPRGKVMTPRFFTSPYASDNIVPARQTLAIPQAGLDWFVSAPRGLVDVQVVVSHSPLTETMNLLEQSSHQATTPTGMVALVNPLQVALALLSDLHQASLPSALSTPEDAWMLNVRDWATLDFSYRVV